MNEEIIFQVKIDRESGGFDLVKRGLNGFEQSAFEQYLLHYVKAMELSRVQDIAETMDYGEDLDEDP